MGGEPGFTFGVLRQDSGEAAQWSQLEGEAERVDADADEGHDAGVLQGVQHAGFLTELREVLHGIHGSQVLQHGIWQDTQPPSHCPAQETSHKLFGRRSLSKGCRRKAAGGITPAARL